MKKIKKAAEVIKTGVLVMAFLHIGLLVVLAIRDRDVSWLNIVTIIDLHQFWPDLLNWEMGFWVFWLLVLVFLGMIWRWGRRTVFNG